VSVTLHIRRRPVGLSPVSGTLNHFALPDELPIGVDCLLLVFDLMHFE